jgi:CheY-like chemotaxis protein
MMSLDLSRCRVLVVDDVESHLEILVNALANDYDVLAATNARKRSPWPASTARTSSSWTS